jgi:iron complex outermembrane receptor protein
MLLRVTDTLKVFTPVRRHGLHSKPHVRRGRTVLAIAVTYLVLSFISSSASAQTPSTSTLKTLSIEELMNIEVTSVSKRPERLFDTASAIQVITRDDIRRSGASSIPEALRLASNLEVAQVDARQWAISARGFNNTASNKLLVLMDGRTLYTPLYAGVFWDAQDTLLDDIDRIEVISGPGGTVWGSNAVNGVINIITRKAKDTQGTLLSAGGGTELRGLVRARYGGSLGPDIQYRIYGKYFDRDSSVLPNGQDAPDNSHSGQIGFRGEWGTSPADTVTLPGDLYNGRVHQLTAPEIGLGGGNIISRWEHTFSEDSDLKLQFYYDRTNRRIPGSIAEGLDIYDVDLQHRFPLGKRHDIVWGVDYRLIEDEIVNPPTLAFLPPHVSRQWFSAFVQDEVALVTDRLHVALGSKIERNDYTGFEFQPTARLVWKMNTQQSLWGAVSRAVRTPSRIDREFFAPRDPPFTVLIGGPNFDSEDLVAYELGYRGQICNNFSLSVATFLNRYDHLRTVEKANPPLPSQIILGNGAEGDAYGAEFAAEYQPRETWRLRAAYSPLRLDFSSKPGSSDPNPGASESHDPGHRFSLRSLLDLPGNLEFDNTFRYVGRIENQNVPAYSELDSRVGWRSNSGLEFSILGENLLHRRHAEFGAFPGRREIERGVRATIVWTF